MTAVTLSYNVSKMRVFLPMYSLEAFSGVFCFVV